MPDDVYDVIMKIHVRAPFRLVRAAAPYFRVKVCRLPNSTSMACGLDISDRLAERNAGKSFHHQRFLNFWSSWKRGSGQLCRRQGCSGRTHKDDRERVGSLWCSRQHGRVRPRSHEVLSLFSPM